MSQVMRKQRLGTARKSTGGTVGGSGGGRRPINCQGGVHRGCDCPACREDRLRTIESYRERRKERLKNLVQMEEEQAARNRRSKPRYKLASAQFQSTLRRVVGHRPEIHPLHHPDPEISVRPSFGGVGGRIPSSRWVMTNEPPTGDWKAVLDLDTYNVGYINRLYYEQPHPHPMTLGDLMDSFVRNRQTLTEVLTILGSACVFLRLVPRRCTPRDLITVRQLDAAYQLENRGSVYLSLELHEDGEENRAIVSEGTAAPDVEEPADPDLAYAESKLGDGS
jgi:hypothetical protein